MGLVFGSILRRDEGIASSDKIGFLFPGQGSQIVGMGKDFFDRFADAKTYYEKAEDVLGFDLAGVSFDGPEEKLKQTRFTQPALYVHSYAIARLLRDKAVIASAAAGHSLGEFSALAYGNTFSFEEGLELVRERANLMQEAGEKKPGSMAAVIGLEPEQVLNLCMEVQEEGIVQPANYNSPEQVVISGSKEGVEAAMALAKERGARRVLPLPVSGAFHSPLMASAVVSFGKKLKEMNIRKPEIPVYANVTAKAVSNSGEIRTLLHHQLTHSVRWIETIQNMVKDGVTRFIEVGAGKVLSGLVRRIDKDVSLMQCGTVDEFDAF